MAPYAGNVGLRLFDPKRLCYQPDNTTTTGDPQFRATDTTQLSPPILRLFRQQFTQYQQPCLYTIKPLRG
ncbi:MAG: hypothetical protein V3R56_05715 [Xanthomonadales bacterium]